MVDRRFSRRDFLKAGGVGIAGTTLLGVAGCGGEEQEEGAGVVSSNAGASASRYRPTSSRRTRIPRSCRTV